MPSNNRANTIRSEDLDVIVSGRRLAVRRIEPPDPRVPDSPVLVFLHEGLGSMQLWGDFPHLIASACGLPALLYDRLGHGLSEPLPSSGVDIAYMDPEVDLFLPAVLSTCNVRQPILIGHSDGGTIALLYAAGAGRQVLGVVTEAAHVIVEDVTRDGIRRQAAAYRETDLKDRLIKYHGEKVEALFRRWADTWVSDEFAPWDIRKRLNTVQCPVLVIQGEADEYATAAQMNDIAASVAGPAETFLVPGCRHVPHYQAREPVAERITAFVRALR
jgi:pimeloyl-ACP methyl ester carboxylesterase